jgi:predicted RNA-binding protein with RPS1 domain
MLWLLSLSLVPRLPPVGSRHGATVKAITPYGAFCTLSEGSAEGLCHISHLDPNGGRVSDVSDIVCVGDRVHVRVLSVDETNGKISLSMRSVPQDEHAPAAIRHYTPPEVLGRPPTAEELGKMHSVSLSFSRASGAGGQNVNKLSTKCEVRLALNAAPWPEAVRTRLRSAGKETSSGDMVVVSERHRTQQSNRKDALEKLASLIAEHWYPPKARRQRTVLSPSAKRKRSDYKRKNSEKKRSRSAARRGIYDCRGSSGDGGFGGRRSVLIRTAAGIAAAAFSTTAAHLMRLGGAAPVHAAIPPPRVVSAEEVDPLKLLPDDKTLYLGDMAPMLSTRFPCVNGPSGKGAVSLSDLASPPGGSKYIVLWTFPENALGLEAANNEKEALNFERLLNDGGKGIGGVSGGPLGFHGLDAIVVGISALSVEETQRALADKLLLTMPFLSDPKRELISAYGAKPGGLPDIVQA